MTATSGQSAGTGDADMPQYYRDFVTQAEHVKARLLAVGEPEATQETRSAPAEKAIDITRMFREAASRHRDELSREGGRTPEP
ncbi:MAG: hypothetical protein WCF33_09845 [Pseudonocardiaceae bacterium]